MLGLRRLTLSSTRCMSRAVPNAGKSRSFGGGGGGAGAKTTPYDLPHDHYPEEAYFGGKKHYEWEGWEGITAFVYITCFFALCFGGKPYNSFRDWATREALAREKLVEDGEEIEFGKYYQTVKYVDLKEENARTSIAED